MDERVFTNPEGPKVTCYQERAGRGQAGQLSLRSGYPYW